MKPEEREALEEEARLVFGGEAARDLAEKLAHEAEAGERPGRESERLG